MRAVRQRLDHQLRLWQRPILVLYLAVALGVVVLGGVMMQRTQRPLVVRLASQQSVQVAGPLTIDLNQEIAPGYKLAIDPLVPGSWRQQQTLLGVTAIMFQPRGRFEAGRTYHLRLSHLRRAVTGLAMPDVVTTFQAQTPPDVVSFSPGVDSRDVPIQPRIRIKLAADNNGVRDLQASLVPAVPLKLVASDGQSFVWTPVTPLPQGATYTFLLQDNRMASASTKLLLTIPFTTVTEPAITAARTGGYLTPGQPIDITFAQAMPADDSSFSFGLPGKGSWLNDHTYRFVSTDLKPATTYQYTVKAGLKSKAGGVLGADRVFQVASNGPVAASLSPGGTVSRRSAIRLAFDQPVDHASAQAHFSITPTVAGSFSWLGNTMTFTPAQLDYQTTYHYGVAAGVAPAWGLANARALSGSFTTETQVVRLNVATYRQQFGRSCELASLRILLAFRGVATTDWDILQRVGYNPRPRDTATNTWDNPNEMFVGRVDTYSWAQGYGVHAGPIALAARSYGRSATAYMGVSAAFIASNIQAGNPVEFWGHISEPQPDSWNTTSGVVQTTTSMHGRVVYGVEGRADAPVGFYIVDPWTANRFYWTTAQLMTNMNAVPPVSNQAVVVY